MFLVAALVVVPTFQGIRSSLILNYLAAGLVIGPKYWDSSATRRLQGPAELGVIFLLFTIGLELTIDRLRVNRRFIFGLGTAQVVVTGAIIGFLATASAIFTKNAVVIGGALALSSTAVVMQLLSERGEIRTQLGRVAFFILLLQDLAVVPVLGGAGEEVIPVVLWTIVKALVAVETNFAFGRLVLRPVFRVIAVGQSPEMFAAMPLMILLGPAGRRHPWVCRSLSEALSPASCLAKPNIACRWRPGSHRSAVCCPVCFS